MVDAECGFLKTPEPIWKDRTIISDFAHEFKSEHEAYDYAKKFNLSYFTILPIYIKE